MLATGATTTCTMEFEIQRLLAEVQRCVQSGNSPEGFRSGTGQETLHLVVSKMRGLFQYLRNSSINAECARICRSNIQVFKMVITQVSPDVKQNTKIIALTLLCLCELARLPDTENVADSPRMYLVKEGFIGLISRLLELTASRSLHSVAVLFFEELSRESTVCSSHPFHQSPATLSLTGGVMLLLTSANLQSKRTAVTVLTSLLSDTSTAKHLLDHTNNKVSNTKSTNGSMVLAPTDSLASITWNSPSNDDGDAEEDMAESQYEWLREAIPQLFRLLLSPGPTRMNYEAGECIALVHRLLNDAVYGRNMYFTSHRQSQEVEQEAVLLELLTNITSSLRQILITSADSQRCHEVMATNSWHVKTASPEVYDSAGYSPDKLAGGAQPRLTRLACYVVAHTFAKAMGDHIYHKSPSMATNGAGSTSREEINQAKGAKDDYDDVTMLRAGGLVESLVYIACKLRIENESEDIDTGGKGPKDSMNVASKSLSIVFGLLESLCEVDDDCMWSFNLLLLRARIPSQERYLHSPVANAYEESCKGHEDSFHGQENGDIGKLLSSPSDYITLIRCLPRSSLSFIVESYTQWVTECNLDSVTASANSLLRMLVLGKHVELDARRWYSAGYAASKGANLATSPPLEENHPVSLYHDSFKDDSWKDPADFTQIDLGYTLFLELFASHGYPRYGLEVDRREDNCDHGGVCTPSASKSSIPNASLSKENARGVSNHAEMEPSTDLEIDQVLVEIGRLGSFTTTKALEKLDKHSPVPKKKSTLASRRVATTKAPNRHSAIAGFASRHMHEFNNTNDVGLDSVSIASSRSSAILKASNTNMQTANMRSSKSTKREDLFSSTMSAARYASPVRVNLESIHRRLIRPKELESRLVPIATGANIDRVAHESGRNVDEMRVLAVEDGGGSPHQTSMSQPSSPRQWRSRPSFLPRHRTKLYKQSALRSIGRDGRRKGDFHAQLTTTIDVEALMPLFADTFQ